MNHTNSRPPLLKRGTLLERAIVALPRMYKTVLMLRDVEEITTVEISAALDIAESTVKVRLHRARALLRRELFQRAGATSAEAFQFPATRCDRVTSQTQTVLGVTQTGDSSLSIRPEMDVLLVETSAERHGHESSQEDEELAPSRRSDC